MKICGHVCAYQRIVPFHNISIGFWNFPDIIVFNCFIQFITFNKFSNYINVNNTNKTATSQLKLLNTEKIKIYAYANLVLAWDSHRRGADLNRLMEYNGSPLDTHIKHVQARFHSTHIMNENLITESISTRIHYMDGKLYSTDCIHIQTNIKLIQLQTNITTF